jgi:hypothetical protein
LPEKLVPAVLPSSEEEIKPASTPLVKPKPIMAKPVFKPKPKT